MKKIFGRNNDDFENINDYDLLPQQERVDLGEFNDYDEDFEKSLEEYDEYYEYDEEYDGEDEYYGDDDDYDENAGLEELKNSETARTMELAVEKEEKKRAEKSDLSKTMEITTVKHLPVPPKVMQIISILKEHTYTSYLVGDCVNLMILGERVMDFDIACDAELERIIAIFDEKFKTREDLLSRGELIIINGAMGISVAPYRSKIDGNGRPVYCKTIDEDLKRRTFTSETVAYDPYAGIYDKYDGLACISEERTVLKAIDEEVFEHLEMEINTAGKKRKKELPEKSVIRSLQENPESILTAMLKHSRNEAEISPYTLKNINDNPELLDMIMPAELSSQFRRILMGRRITETLLKFKGVIFHIFPILEKQDDFDQRSDYQEYTLYDHTAKAVGYAFPDFAVRMALLLHSIGKPDCAAERGDHNTYDGHAERGVMLARTILEDLEIDEQTIMRVLFLIRHHDDKITSENLLDYSGHYGAEMTRILLLMQSANIRAKSSDPLNDRVSMSLRQLADNVTSLQRQPARGLRQAANGTRGRYGR